MNTTTIIMIIAIILYVIIPSCKDRVIPVKKLLITPAIFLYLFYQTINENFLINQFDIALGFITGIAIGLWFRRNTNIKSDKNQLLIWIPGSYISIVIFCLIFSIHFVIGYLQSVNPGYLALKSLGQSSLLFLLSCASSIIVGANGSLYLKYLKCKDSIQLDNPKKYKR